MYFVIVSRVSGVLLLFSSLILVEFDIIGPDAIPRFQPRLLISPKSGATLLAQKTQRIISQSTWVRENRYFVLNYLESTHLIIHELAVDCIKFGSNSQLLTYKWKLTISIQIQLYYFVLIFVQSSICSRIVLCK